MRLVRPPRRKTADFILPGGISGKGEMRFAMPQSRAKRVCLRARMPSFQTAKKAERRLCLYHTIIYTKMQGKFRRGRRIFRRFPIRPATRPAAPYKSKKTFVPVYTINRRGRHRRPQPPDIHRRLSGMDGRRGKKTRICSFSVRRCRAVKIRLPRKRFSARRQNGGKSQKPLPFCSDSAGYSGGTKTAAAVRGLPDAGIALRRFSPIRPTDEIRSSAAPR